MQSNKFAWVPKILFLFIVLEVFFCFLPFRNMVNPLSADGGIPIIMSQNPIPSIYSFYYYGQNRFGAYPFVFIFFISKIFNFTATASTIYCFAYAYFVAALLFLTKSVKVNGLFIVSIFLFLSVIFLKFSSIFLSMHMPYIWQISSLFLYAYFFMRSINKTIHFRDYFLSILFAFFAISSNPISMPYLFSMLPLIFVFRNEITRIMSLKKFCFHYLMSFIPAFFLEEIIKLFYNKHNQIYFGTNFSFPIEQLDLNNFFNNIVRFTNMVFISPIWLIIIGIVFIVTTLFMLKYKDKKYLLPFSFFILAIVNFMICTVSRYVSSNSEPIRYFMPTYCFLFLALAFSIAELLSVMRRAKSFVQIFLLLGISITSFFYLSRTKNNLIIENIQWQAETLSQLYPKTDLWGRYWDVYLYRALQPNLNMAAYAVPQDGDYNRTMWNLCRLKVGEYIIVLAPSTFKIKAGNRMVLDQNANFISNFEDYGFKFSLEEDKRFSLLQLPFQRYKIVSGQRNFYDKITE